MRLGILCLGVILSCFCVAGALACSISLPIWSITDNSADPLYRYVENGKVGYIDNTGKVVIRPRFESFGGNFGGEFHEGLLEVSGEGYVDTKGDTVIRKISDSEFDFSEGLASFSEDHRYGFIDRNGKVVIKPQYDVAGSFSNGLAMAWVEERAGYIGKDGAFAIKPSFLRAGSFHEERAWVVAEGPCRWQSSIDTLQPIDPLQPAEAGQIRQIMIVTADSSCSRSSTTLPVSMYADLNLRKPCRYALIDKSGTILSDARFDEALDFSEGLAAVQVGKLWGFVDRAGRMVIAPRFRSSGRFSGGIAAVAVEGEPDSKPLWGYIDTSGVFVIPPQFQRAQAFSDGLAVVGDGDFVWYIDRSGRSPIAGKFRAAGRFFKGLAHVEQSHVRAQGRRKEEFRYAYIDRTGKAVFTYTDRRD